MDGVIPSPARAAEASSEMVVADLRPRPNNAINERFRTHPQSPIGYAFSTVLADLVHHNSCGGDLRKVDGRECSDPEVSKDNKTCARGFDAPTNVDSKSYRGADVAGRVPGDLHSDDFSLGGFCRLRQ